MVVLGLCLLLVVLSGTLNGVSEGQLATLKMMALDKDAHCVEAQREHRDTVNAIEECLAKYPGPWPATGLPHTCVLLHCH